MDANLNMTPTQLVPLVDLVKGAQALLTEHMQPMGPSKADTIGKLTDLLLGVAAGRALTMVGAA